MAYSGQFSSQPGASGGQFGSQPGAYGGQFGASGSAYQQSYSTGGQITTTTTYSTPQLPPVNICT